MGILIRYCVIFFEWVWYIDKDNENINLCYDNIYKLNEFMDVDGIFCLKKFF